MKNMISVSIGLSAFNEENNIKVILKDIISQKQTTWKIKEILVYSDGSTDTTVSQAKMIRNKLIRIVAYSERKGKTARLQQMFKDMKGEVLVMFDADIRLKNNKVIDELMKPFYKDDRVMLVGGNTMPFPPKSFFQQSVYSTFIVFYESRIKIKNGNNVFGCTGGCLAIRKDLAKKIIFPKIKNDDVYLYFSCISKGFIFRYVDSAIAFYKLPANLNDYLKQIFRSNPESVYINFTKYFGDLVHTEYKRKASFYLFAVLKSLLKRPLPTISIIVINIAARPFFRLNSNKATTTWEIAYSTK
jgi:glycosyltransferase involved in cell wall biosynthesis